MPGTLTQVKGREEERRVNESMLDLMHKPFSKTTRESLSQRDLSGEPCVSQEGVCLGIPSALTCWLGAARGLCTNTVMDFRAWQLRPSTHHAPCTQRSKRCILVVPTISTTLLVTTTLNCFKKWDPFLLSLRMTQA